MELKNPDLTALGSHLLVELQNCDISLLKGTDVVERLMLAAIRRAGANIVQSVFHQFAPVGVSGVVVIAESHVTIHTWPEHSYAAVDVFTCGDPELATRIHSEMETAFQSQTSEAKMHHRGPLVKE